MSTVGFIGLGNMGHPMAGHLAAAGHTVQVFNRTTDKAEAWAEEHGGTIAATPAEAASGATFVFTCVGGDDDVRAVTTGRTGALAAMAPGTVLVDHTTASAELARELADASAAVGVDFVDAPISGGQAGAQDGVLSVMCGGEPHVFERVRPVMEAYGRTITLIGPTPAGQLTKIVNQILCAGAVQGAAEALAVGMAAGLDMDKVLATVTQGAAGSWYLANRGETMVRDEFEFGFSVDWYRKDLGICMAEAERLGIETPLAHLVDDYMARAQDAGDNRLDVTSIIRRYRT